MSDREESSTKIVSIGIIGLLIFSICLSLFKPAEKVQYIAPTKKDTILSGMHYIIWTEPSGDMWVINSTIDSLKAQMFNRQIR